MVLLSMEGDYKPIERVVVWLPQSGDFGWDSNQKKKADRGAHSAGRIIAVRFSRQLLLHLPLAVPWVPGQFQIRPDPLPARYGNRLR